MEKWLRRVFQRAIFHLLERYLCHVHSPFARYLDNWRIFVSSSIIVFSAAVFGFIVCLFVAMARGLVNILLIYRYGDDMSYIEAAHQSGVFMRKSVCVCVCLCVGVVWVCSCVCVGGGVGVFKCVGVVTVTVERGYRIVIIHLFFAHTYQMHTCTCTHSQCTHTHAHTTHIHSHTCAHTQTHKHTYTHTHMHTHTRTLTHAHTQA